MIKESQLKYWGATVWMILVVVVGCSAPDSRQKEVSQKVVSDTVEIRQMQFHPSIITIEKGTSIVFVNRDLVDHDVTEETSKAWTSGPLKPGASWTRTFVDDEDYFCSLHVIMKGQIRLQP